MMKNNGIICVVLLILNLFTAMTGSAAEGTASETSGKTGKAPFVLKLKNPYEKDLAKIEAMSRKHELLPVGKKRDAMDDKIVAEKEKLKKKMEKNVQPMMRELERLERQYERAKDESKQKELGIKINQIRAAIALHRAWCSDDPDELNEALAFAEKAFSPDATGIISEDGESDGEGDSKDAKKDTPKDEKGKKSEGTETGEKEGDGEKKPADGSESEDKSTGKQPAAGEKGTTPGAKKSGKTEAEDGGESEDSGASDKPAGKKGTKKKKKSRK